MSPLGSPGACACSTTACSQRTESTGLTATLALPSCFRRRITQPANVEYFTPTSAANLLPLNPLRSNSASNCSRRSAGVRTRPTSSVFNTCSPASIEDVIAPRLRHLRCHQPEVLRVTLTILFRKRLYCPQDIALQQSQKRLS